LIKDLVYILIIGKFLLIMGSEKFTTQKLSRREVVLTYSVKIEKKGSVI